MPIAPGVTTSGVHVASSRHYRQQAFYLRSNTECYAYNPATDGWITLPSPGLAGTFGAGAAGVCGAWSTGSTVGAASLTATSGTTSTIVTNQTLARDLRGFRVQILAGPNAGAVLEILRNTIAANATITVATQGSAFSASTVFRLLAPRYFVVSAGTLAAGSFRVYDFATNTWTSLSITGLPATLGTDGRLVATPSLLDSTIQAFASGTATAGGASTLDNSAKTWTVNQWTNYQIRITAGTGAGQIRTIASNTATQITVSAAWTTSPDATSQYSIEGNDDFLYYLGNAAVAMYRYQISTNTWTTLSPTVARTGAPGAALSAEWLRDSPAPDWTNESDIKNGRFIYSFRGGAANDLARYDIALNAWTAMTYSPSSETFTTGAKYVAQNGSIYIHHQSGRLFRYDVALSEMFPWGVFLYAQGTALVGNTCFDVVYRDGATTIYYVYMVLNSSNVMLRMMEIA
jgi:hypothetical protein